MVSVTQLLAEIHACKICEPHLPLDARPVLQIHPSARILIVGQAPGKKVHQSGIPFNDASGDRLRAWMGVTPEVFYDPEIISILPMGFCYPGTGKSGDLPPRPECAIAWRQPLFEVLEQLELTLVLGRYAQSYHLHTANSQVTEAVKSWQQYWPTYIPLPHPSPRNNRWLKQNPWFEAELLPALRRRVAEILRHEPT
ncbi:MAG: uracil-DNA glycosylase family protein [Methylomonas sp.]